MATKDDAKQAKPVEKPSPSGMTLEKAKALGVDPVAYGLKAAD
jgi:hypothetical protein